MPSNYIDVHSAHTQKYWLYLLQEKWTQCKDAHCYWSLQEKESIWQYREHSESFLSKPIGPIEIVWKEMKKKPQITLQKPLSRILQKGAKIIGMLSVSSFTSCRLWALEYCSIFITSRYLRTSAAVLPILLNVNQDLHLPKTFKASLWTNTH